MRESKASAGTRRARRVARAWLGGVRSVGDKRAPNRFPIFLPAYYQRKNGLFGRFLLFLALLVHLLGAAPFAILFELDLAFDELLVLAGPIVSALAFPAGELD